MFFLPSVCTVLSLIISRLHLMMPVKLLRVDIY